MTTVTVGTKHKDQPALLHKVGDAWKKQQRGLNSEFHQTSRIFLSDKQILHC